VEEAAEAIEAKGGGMRYNFIPAHIACPGSLSVVWGALEGMIECQAQDLIADLDKEAARFEAAGDAEMAAKLREWKAEFEAIWDEPACPACETGRLIPREQPDVWDCDTCGATVCPGEPVTCPDCGQAIKWDGDVGHCGCQELTEE
jgi:ribosomal protein L37AE/L43A